MPTGNNNNKSIRLSIRFPHKLKEAIAANVTQRKKQQPNANLSAWVLDACKRKLKDEEELNNLE